MGELCHISMAQWVPLCIVGLFLQVGNCFQDPFLWLNDSPSSSPILDLCPVSSVSLLPNVPSIFPMLWRVLPTLDTQVDGRPISALYLDSLLPPCESTTKNKETATSLFCWFCCPPYMKILRWLSCSLEISTQWRQLVSQLLSQIGFKTQTSLSMSWGADAKLSISNFCYSQGPPWPWGTNAWRDVGLEESHENSTWLGFSLETAAQVATNPKQLITIFMARDTLARAPRSEWGHDQTLLRSFFK